MRNNNYPPRIGGSERQRQTLKYASPGGTCSRLGCANQLRRAPNGWYGKFCNPCSRKLIEHGDFYTTVPSLAEKPIAILYVTIKDIIKECIQKNHYDIASNASSIMRCTDTAEWEKMGDPLYALRSDEWLYHHYIHHKLKNLRQHPVEAMLHLMGVTGVTQIAPQYFVSPDQTDLFMVKRGLGRGLPSIRVSAIGDPVPHGRWSLRKARMLANKMRGDWGLDAHLQRLVAEETLRKINCIS